MSELPKGWKRATLDAIADVLDFEREPINSSERESRIAGKSDADLYPYYGATGQVGFIDSFRSEGQRVLLGEDAAPFLDPVKDKAYLANGRFWVNNHAHVLVGAVGLIDNKFLCYQLNTVDYHPFVTGSTRLKLTSSAMKQIPMAVAPAIEQTRIIAKLEELLSDLDAGVAELKAAQRKLKQYRQSLLKAAVEGALTAEWRARNKPAETGAQLLQRILTERRARWEAKQLAKFKEQGKAPPKDWQKKYPEPVQPDASGLPQLPQGWVWATIDQIAQVGTGVTPLRSKSAYFNEGTIPWVTSGALNSEAVASATELVTELALKECRLELYPVGSLLVAMYGEGKTRGKCSELRIPATINQAIAAIVLEPAAQSCKAYLKAFLLDSYEKMRAQASGGVQPNLNLQIVKAIALPLPPCSEQAEITQLLDGQFDQISQQQIAVQVSLQQSTAQRQNILRAAFSGQLVPQDPHDEPASVLLERIRAERAARDAVKKPRGRKAQEAA